MYTNKELANALKMLVEECRSHNRCMTCPLRFRKGCGIEYFPSDKEIEELGERDG